MEKRVLMVRTVKATASATTLGILALAAITLPGIQVAETAQQPQDNSPVLGLGTVHVGQVFSLPSEPWAPLTATVESETTQVLSDRTVAVHKSTSFVARDSKGRTMKELPTLVDEQNGLQPETLQVILYNPATKVRTILSPKMDLATQALAKPSSILGAPAPTSGAPAKTNRGTAQRSASAEQLEVDYMDGFQVKHYRERRIIPIGPDGNDGEIETVYEYWYAPELKLKILSRRDDPRTGAQSARLKEIRWGDPNASLFEIPPGCKVLAAE